MDDAKLVKVLKALADSNRFRMVRTLAQRGELSCGELAVHFHLSQPTISHHLKVLDQAGLIKVRKDAQHHFVQVDEKLLAKVVGLIPMRLSTRKSRLRKTA